MRRCLCILIGLAAISACGAGATRAQRSDLVFLTRPGCVQTTLMRVRLDAAITAIGQPLPYTVVDLDTLPASDTRTGYPTPTILVGGVDLFGMPAPTPPFPEPT
jgi:hypothetical protein